MCWNDRKRVVEGVYIMCTSSENQYSRMEKVMVS